MSSPISPERIINGASSLWEEEISAQVAQQAKWREKSEANDAHNQAKQALFESQKPALLQRARGEHYRRFEPLHKIVVSLIPSLQALRNHYLPGSRLVTAEEYADTYDPDPCRKTDNQYSFGAMILDLEDPLGRNQRVFFAVASAREPEDARWLKFLGSPPQITFGLWLGWQEVVNYGRNDYSWARLLNKRAEEIQGDSAFITLQEELYHAEMADEAGNGRVVFRTAPRLLPDLSYRYGDRIAVVNGQLPNRDIEKKLSRLFVGEERKIRQTAEEAT